MISDAEIIALAVHHRVRVATGTASIELAGADLMRDLVERGKAADMGTPEPCGHVSGWADASEKLRSGVRQRFTVLWHVLQGLPRTTTPPGVLGN